MATQRIAILGLGEAGSLIAADLVAAGVDVVGYDPAPVSAPNGVTMVGSAGEAASRAGVVLSVNWASAAVAAAKSASEGLTAGKLYAELNTGSPALMREVAALIAPSGAQFVDVALMSNVPGKGVRTPMVVAGQGAAKFAELIRRFGTAVEVLDGEAGAASGRKLLRSVFMKGFGTVVVEALEAARLAGLEDWMSSQIQEVFATPGEVERFDRGTRLHATRRLHEMEAALELLSELGAQTNVTEATVASLKRLSSEAQSAKEKARADHE